MEQQSPQRVAVKMLQPQAASVVAETPPTKNCDSLQTIRTAFPMQVVSVDILGPLLESEGGNSYICTGGW